MEPENHLSRYIAVLLRRWRTAVSLTSIRLPDTIPFHGPKLFDISPPLFLLALNIWFTVHHF